MEDYSIIACLAHFSRNCPKEIEKAKLPTIWEHQIKECEKKKYLKYETFVETNDLGGWTAHSEYVITQLGESELLYRWRNCKLNPKNKRAVIINNIVKIIVWLIWFVALFLMWNQIFNALFVS